MEDRADDQEQSGGSVAAGVPIAFDVHSCSMDSNILPAVSTFLVSESCVELSLGIVQRAFTTPLVLFVRLGTDFVVLPHGFVLRRAPSTPSVAFYLHYLASLYVYFTGSITVLRVMRSQWLGWCAMGSLAQLSACSQHKAVLCYVSEGHTSMILLGPQPDGAPDFSTISARSVSPLLPIPPFSPPIPSFIFLWVIGSSSSSDGVDDSRPSLLSLSALTWLAFDELKLELSASIDAHATHSEPLPPFPPSPSLSSSSTFSQVIKIIGSSYGTNAIQPPVLACAALARLVLAQRNLDLSTSIAAHATPAVPLPPFPPSPSLPSSSTFSEVRKIIGSSYGAAASQPLMLACAALARLAVALQNLGLNASFVAHTTTAAPLPSFPPPASSLLFPRVRETSPLSDGVTASQPFMLASSALDEHIFAHHIIGFDASFAAHMSSAVPPLPSMPSPSPSPSSSIWRVISLIALLSGVVACQPARLAPMAFAWHTFVRPCFALSSLLIAYAPFTPQWFAWLSSASAGLTHSCPNFPPDLAHISSLIVLTSWP